VRDAHPRDLDRLVELWSDLADHHARVDPLFELRSDAGPRVRELLAAGLRGPDAATFVWEMSGGTGPIELVGFCTLRIDRAPSIQHETERAEITDLGVSPAQRRRGIGRALVAAARDWLTARGVERVEVRVATGNPEGQAFWRALGFDDFVDVLHRRL
jgi:ribosomal protein S18 acetylase RimI-like enzyme